MSRFSLRSATLLAAVVTTPFAARYLSNRSTELPSGSAMEQQARTGFLHDAERKRAPHEPLSPESPDSPNAQAVQAATDSASEAGQAALAQTVCSFLEEYAGFHPPNAAELHGAAIAKPLPCAPGPTPEKPRVLVAVLPNPVHTHLELRFDRAIDDLQDAAQDRGWQFDSDWIPWENRAHEESDSFGERLLDEAARHGREITAGTLLFRPNGEPADSASGPLIVLIVGDTPTGGLSAPPFHSAMRMWAALRPSLADSTELNILGPSFSGSVQSLVHLLSAELQQFGDKPGDPCGGIAVNVVSGTVTGSEQLEVLRAGGSFAPDGAVAAGQKGCVPKQVLSFAMDGQYEADALRLFLRRKDPRRRVAQLVEAESAFGTSLLPPHTPSHPKRAANPLPGSYLVLQFPREISRLREAYEENSIIGFGSSADSPRSELRFATGDQHRGTDTVPTFSGTQQTLSMESRMAEIAATLNQERIATVLLSATDVFDEIFVARYLQQHAPRATVIIQDADLLFLRRGEDAGLQNTYVASPWPLIPQNQFWTADAGAARLQDGGRQKPQIDIHQSQGDQGAHAAALYLMPCPTGRQCSPAANEYRSPLPGTSLFATHPALWLSMIGRGQFAPIALVDSDLLDAGFHLPGEDADFGSSTSPAMIPTPSINAGEGISTAANAAASRTNLPDIARTPTDAGQPSRPIGVFAELPLQTKLLGAIFAILLGWHGFACALSRLDRRFAWSYALADAGQRSHRLAVRAALSFAAVPALALLLVPNHGLETPGGHLSPAIYFLQAVSIGLASWSIRQWWVGRMWRAVSAAAPASSTPESISYAEFPATCEPMEAEDDPPARTSHHYTQPAPAVRRFKNRLPLPKGFEWVPGTVVFAFSALLLAGFTVLINTWIWPLIEPRGQSERVFFLYRCVLMTPGISPSLTLLLLLCALSLWGHSYFARWSFFGHRIPDLPQHHARDLSCPSPASVAGITNLFSNREISPPCRETPAHWSHRPPFCWFHKEKLTNYSITLASFALVIVVLWISGSSGPESLENGPCDHLTRVLTGLLATVIVNDIAVAVWGWNLLHQSCLLPLRRSPLRWGFNWIKGFSWRGLWTSSFVLSPDLIFDYLGRMLQANSRSWANVPEIETLHQELIQQYYNTAIKDERWSVEVARLLKKLHAAFANEADVILTQLCVEWKKDHGPLTGSESARGNSEQAPLDELRGDEHRAALDRMAKEEFVAMLYLGYIRMVLIQIRNRIMTALVCYVLLVWALTSYSWTNHHAIIVALSALLGLLSLAVLYIYSGMHRDDILSRTTETESGKLDSEFFEKTIPTLGIPLLSLIATQFPEFSDLIFSFIEPGLRGH